MEFSTQGEFATSPHESNSSSTRLFKWETVTLHKSVVPPFLVLKMTHNLQCVGMIILYGPTGPPINLAQLQKFTRPYF